MVEKMALRVLQENVQVKELLDKDFLKKLEENFDDYDVVPIAISFSLEKEGITKDAITLIHRNETDFKEKKVVVDVNESPEVMDMILKTFE